MWRVSMFFGLATMLLLSFQNCSKPQSQAVEASSITSLSETDKCQSVNRAQFSIPDDAVCDAWLINWESAQSAATYYEFRGSTNTYLVEFGSLMQLDTIKMETAFTAAQDLAMAKLADAGRTVTGEIGFQVVSILYGQEVCVRMNAREPFTGSVRICGSSVDDDRLVLIPDEEEEEEEEHEMHVEVLNTAIERYNLLVAYTDTFNMLSKYLYGVILHPIPRDHINDDGIAIIENIEAEAQGIIDSVSPHINAKDAIKAELQQIISDTVNGSLNSDDLAQIKTRLEAMVGDIDTIENAIRAQESLVNAFNQHLIDVELLADPGM